MVSPEARETLRHRKRDDLALTHRQRSYDATARTFDDDDDNDNDNDKSITANSSSAMRPPQPKVFAIEPTLQMEFRNSDTVDSNDGARAGFRCDWVAKI